MADATFSTLGQYVNAPHQGSSNKRVSGTSVAAVVAVGIAALVLEFVRQPRVDGQKPIQNVESLRTKEGMLSVFSLMYNRFEPGQMTETVFNLKPWYLLGSDFDGGDDEAARVNIAADINRALTNLKH